MQKNTPKKKQEMKITWHYKEPQNEDEVKEEQKRLDEIFDILFEEVLKHRKTNNMDDNKILK